MARKPHNYAHFQNLVNELKDQNAGNIASLQSHLEIQTDVLQSMKGFMLQGVQLENEDLKRDRDKNGKAKPSNSFLGIEKQLESQTVVLKEMSKFFNTKLPDVLLKETEPEKEQTSILSRMLGFWRKKEKDDIKRDKENRLEGRDSKGKKKEWVLPKGMRAGGGKGFMGMLGNFLSTALLGIPGGLRRFMPRALGLALLPKLARGVALMITGPRLIQAMEAGFDQKTFSGGVTGFIDSYFAHGGEGYTSLAMAAAGGAGKAAVLGFALLGPRGAIIAGILGGALTGLNHIFAEDKSKMNSKGVFDAVKEHLKTNLTGWAGGLGAFLGAKTFMALGPAGMIAGAILGAGVGIIGAGTIKEMMKVEKAGEKDVGKAFRQGLKNYLVSEEFAPVAKLMPYGAGLFGAAAFAGFGPAGMLAGMILGAGAGIIGGPVLVEALKAQGTEGGALADHMKTALWKYLKNSPYIQKALFGAGLFGIAGMMGLGPLGLVAGIFVGGIVGIIAQWITETLGDLAGAKFKKAFGVEKILTPLEKELAKTNKTADYRAKQLATQKKGTFHKKGVAGFAQGFWGGKADPYEQMQTLYSGYLQALAEGRAQGMYQEKGVFHPSAASHVSRHMNVLEGKDSAEFDAIKLKFLQNKLDEERKNTGRPDTGSSSSIMQDQSVQNVDVNYFTEGQMDYLDMNGKGLIENVR